MLVQRNLNGGLEFTALGGFYDIAVRLCEPCLLKAQVIGIGGEVYDGDVSIAGTFSAATIPSISPINTMSMSTRSGFLVFTARIASSPVATFQHRVAERGEGMDKTCCNEGIVFNNEDTGLIHHHHAP